MVSKIKKSITVLSLQHALYPLINQSSVCMWIRQLTIYSNKHGNSFYDIVKEGQFAYVHELQHNNHYIGKSLKINCMWSI